MQLLVWLQRVQAALVNGLGKSGPDMLQFVQQIAHAARVMLFQPMLLHGLQVVRYVQSLTAEDVHGSMARAMQYPLETATDAERVEWLQLNLLLQFQSLFRDVRSPRHAGRTPAAGDGGERATHALRLAMRLTARPLSAALVRARRAPG
eukprot:5675516-Prymnesium_polylepis.1